MRGPGPGRLMRATVKRQVFFSSSNWSKWTYDDENKIPSEVCPAVPWWQLVQAHSETPRPIVTQFTKHPFPLVTIVARFIQEMSHEAGKFSLPFRRVRVVTKVTRPFALLRRMRMLWVLPPDLQTDEEVQLRCPIFITSAEDIEDEEVDIQQLMISWRWQENFATESITFRIYRLGEWPFGYPWLATGPCNVAPKNIFEETQPGPSPPYSIPHLWRSRDME